MRPDKKNSIALTCKNLPQLTYHSADKLEVAEMVRVAVGRGVDHVSDSVSG
jgi:hypothetical protein